MKAIRSRITAQGQISVPAEIRKRLGIGPGSVLEWDTTASQITVRKAGRFTSAEVSAGLFPEGPPGKLMRSGIKDGIRKSVRKRHARD